MHMLQQPEKEPLENSLDTCRYQQYAVGIIQSSFDRRRKKNISGVMHAIGTLSIPVLPPRKLALIVISFGSSTVISRPRLSQ
jgi:hypothetical protein